MWHCNKNQLNHLIALSALTLLSAILFSITSCDKLSSINVDSKYIGEWISLNKDVNREYPYIRIYRDGNALIWEEMKGKKYVARIDNGILKISKKMSEISAQYIESTGNLIATGHEYKKIPKSPQNVHVIHRRGLFLAYSDGTVLDIKANLMWASNDNNEAVNWQQAKNYCESYQGSGYSDWRMPTIDELSSLYDKNKAYKVVKPSKTFKVFLTDLIKLSHPSLWASDTRGTEASFFVFSKGLRAWELQAYDGGNRALPVRSAK